ncbi:MAG: hypothetical protein JWM05_1010 [Acidimicrobiales bacterium]|nr:hypothetical protein [Acidimicrobiales bacterium]
MRVLVRLIVLIVILSTLPVIGSVSGAAAATVPSAPTIGIVVRGNQSVTVHWSAPSSDGGSSVTGYVVQPFRDVTALTPVPFNSTATTQTINGLENGRAYEFRVAATNSVGTGAYSGLSTVGLPDTVPPAPSIAPVTTFNQAAVVKWNPTGTGAAPAGYRIQPFKGLVAQPIRTVGASVAPQVFTGLTNGAAYRFRVAARNGVGWGPYSAFSVTVIPTNNCLLAPGPGVNWRGCNLAGRDLSGAHLSTANLTSANLTGAILAGADLRGTDFTRASLHGASLSSASLDNGTILSGVSSGGIVGSPLSIPGGWRLVNGYVVGYAANLAGANLIGANLIGANLTRTNLTGANLTNADLTSVKLESADLTGATIQGTNFTRAILWYSLRSQGISGTPAVLPSPWRLVSGYLLGPAADLNGANLAGLNLSGVTLGGAMLTGSNLSGTDLTGAKLSGAVLSSANLSNAVLTNALLNNVRSTGIAGIPAALPANWRVIRGHLVGPGAFLFGADLSGLNLSGINLTGTWLGSANFTGTNLTSANLSNAVLGSATLVGTNLTGANLNHTALGYANLNNANLTSANLTAAVSGGIGGIPAALPTGWTLNAGFLTGP